MAQWPHTLSCAIVFILRVNYSDHLYRLSTASPSTQSVLPGRGAKWLIYKQRERERASDYHHNESLLLILLLCTTKAFEQYAFALSRRVGALQISIICSRGNNLWGTITLWSRRVVPLEPLAQTRTKLKKKRKSLSLIIFVFYCADHV